MGGVFRCPKLLLTATAITIHSLSLSCRHSNISKQDKDLGGGGGGGGAMLKISVLPPPQVKPYGLPSLQFCYYTKPTLGQMRL